MPCLSVWFLEIVSGIYLYGPYTGHIPETFSRYFPDFTSSGHEAGAYLKTISNARKKFPKIFLCHNPIFLKFYLKPLILEKVSGKFPDT